MRGHKNCPFCEAQLVQHFKFEEIFFHQTLELPKTELCFLSGQRLSGKHLERWNQRPIENALKVELDRANNLCKAKNEMALADDLVRSHLRQVNGKLQHLLRQLFYARVGSGQKVEEFIVESGDSALWNSIHEALENGV